MPIDGALFPSKVSCMWLIKEWTCTVKTHVERHHKNVNSFPIQNHVAGVAIHFDTTDLFTHGNYSFGKSEIMFNF